MLGFDGQAPRGCVRASLGAEGWGTGAGVGVGGAIGAGGAVLRAAGVLVSTPKRGLSVDDCAAGAFAAAARAGTTVVGAVGGRCGVGWVAWKPARWSALVSWGVSNQQRNGFVTAALHRQGEVDALLEGARQFIEHGGDGRWPP